jgi:putative aldouronate transport system substrate-binding protein
MMKHALSKPMLLAMLLALLLSACAGPPQAVQSAAAPADQPAATPVPADVLAAQPWRQTDAYSPLPERASLVLVKGGQENASLMPEGESIEDNRALQYIEDTLNVDISFAWVVPSDSYIDKLNFSIASGDIPDVMIVDAIQLQQLVEAGAIEDLTEIHREVRQCRPTGELESDWRRGAGCCHDRRQGDGHP